LPSTASASPKWDDDPLESDIPGSSSVVIPKSTIETSTEVQQEISPTVVSVPSFSADIHSLEKFSQSPATFAQEVVPLRRSTRVVKPPAWLENYVSNNRQLLQPTVHYVVSSFVKPKFQTFLSAVISSCDHASFQEVLQDPKWCTAMNLELGAMEENGTWCIIDLPPGRKAIRYKWIFKTNYHSYASIDKHKARLVI